MNNVTVFRRFVESIAVAAVFLITAVPRADAEQFSIIVLPDTQSYLNSNAAIFAAQTQWIALNAVSENIIYVTHLGDIVNTISCDPTDQHWATANDAFTTLDVAGVPYGIHPGNHDYDLNPGNNACSASQPTINYNVGTLGRPGFGADRYPSPPYGPAAEQFDPSPVSPSKENDNNFILFESPLGAKFIGLNLAWSNINEAAVLTWADATLKAYPDRKAIVTSHQIARQQAGGSPCDSVAPGNYFGTYGGAMWNALKGNPNLYMMLSGHCRGEAYVRMTGQGVQTELVGVDADRACMSDVHVMMSNYQFMDYTGGAGDPSNGSLNTGYLRIMRFDTIANTVDVETFSPWIETYPGGSEPATGTGTIATMGETASTYTIDYDTSISPSGVVLLPDTSGSMGWGIDGTPGVAANLQRITYARQAASVFVDLMATAPASPAVINLGLATFPSHPPPFFTGSAERIIDMTMFDSTLQANMQTAISTQLNPGGGTPLLSGLIEANDMMAGMDCRVVVLLSDGAHNVPFAASDGDPAVDAALATLGAGGPDPTQVYAINFAGPGEGDIPLLQQIATDTGGINQFFDATTDISGIDFSTELGLTTIYKSIMADVFNLEVGIDPIATIVPGATNSFLQSVNEFDNKVTFIISWRPGDEPLTVAVFDASGVVVNPGDAGVDLIRRNSYLIFSVGRETLAMAGRVGPKPWRVDVSHLRRDCEQFSCFDDVQFDDVGQTLEEQSYQYSALLDSGLKFRTVLGPSNPFVGSTIRMTAELAEGRRPILGLQQIEVIVNAPGDGQGNWYAENIISSKQLDTIPTQQGDESLSPIFRKAIYLNRVAGIVYPARKLPQTIRLFDDGTNGDVAAGDGVYTNTYSDTVKEGVYSFTFKAAGSTRHGNPFNREKLLQEYLGVRPIADAILLTAVPLGVNGTREFDFSVVPKDSLGNFFGPGHAGRIAFEASNAGLEGSLRDNLDGSYVQTLVLDTGVDEDDVNIGLDVAGVKIAVNLGDVLRGDDPEILMCDTNGDGAVDITDIRAIAAKRNQPATGPDDPMDWNQDGVITVADARGCQSVCTLPRCAVQR